MNCRQLQRYASFDNLAIVRARQWIGGDAQSFTATVIATSNIPSFPGTFYIAQPFAKMPQDLHLFKFGVNYHFSPAPVVVSARY